MARVGRLLLAAALAAALVVAGAGPASALVPSGPGWFWQLPQPAGSAGMAALSFPTATDVWSVGAGGLVQHSADAGHTWVVQPTGTAADLWSVSFADGLHGAVCGDAVLVTADGGLTWADRTPPQALAPKGLTTISCTDPLHLWAGTADGAVLRTSDGGVTWQRRGLPGYTRGAACDFVDAAHGWAAGDGDRAWSTANGGRTWTPQSVGLARSHDLYGQVDFFDRRHGWLLEWSPWDATSAFFTADGGRHWLPVRGVEAAASGLVATGPSSAWVVAADSIWSGDDTVVLQHTTDGGQRWSSTRLGCPVTPSSIAARGDRVVAVGDGVLVSADAGATWQAASSGQSYAFTGVQALSPTNVWAVEYNGALLHSADGLRWQEQTVPERWHAPLYGVSFPDAQDGWVVGGSDFWDDGGVILHTADGGATWAPQTSILGGSLVGVQFVDKHTGWAISDGDSPWGLGANTCLERTTDGGQTWLPLYVAPGAAFSGVQFLDSGLGWVTGTYQPAEDDTVPAIYKTLNGGATWARERLPKDAPEMSGVYFTDAANGWAVGVAVNDETGAETGWVLHTTDGGATWVRVPGAGDILGYSVCFTDAQHGWIGGDDGVYATTDGGATWRVVTSGWGVTAVSAADTRHVWAVGMGFVVSTVDGSGDTAAPATVERVVPGGMYSRKPVSLQLPAGDIGGSGLAGAEYKIDGGAWLSGDSVQVAAPADHSNDGQHTVYFRATDNAGNREATQDHAVIIDTLGPACSAPRPMVADAGGSGILYFSAADATSGVRRAVLILRDAHGRVVRRITEHGSGWQAWPAPSYYWRRFNCDLAPGRYRLEVRAVDYAGNRQISVGRNWLRVVRRGAPQAHGPWWPQGLPGDSSGFGARHGGLQRLSAHRAALRGMILSSALPYRLARQQH